MAVYDVIVLPTWLLYVEVSIRNIKKYRNKPNEVKLII